MTEPDPTTQPDPVARRRVRQLADILELLDGIPDGRAGALIAEHLREFPGDMTELHHAMEDVHARLIEQPDRPPLS